MSVSDAEVADEYRRRNEKVKLDVVPVNADAFKSQVTVTDADLAAHFDKNKESYRIGEKRKIKYALVDVDEVRASDHRARRRDRGVLQAEPRAVLDAGAGARQPHPVQDRRQGRERRPGAGRRRAEEGARPARTSRRSPSSTPKTTRTTTTAATSITSASGRMVPEFEAGGVRDEERRDQQSRQDRVRVPHHQDGGQPARGRASARRGEAARSTISSAGRRPSRTPKRRPRRSPRRQDAGGSRSRSPKRAQRRVPRIRALPPRRPDRPARPAARAGRPRVRREGRRSQRRRSASRAAG